MTIHSRVRLFLLALPLAMASVGCAGPSTNLKVTSLQDHKTYQQRFSEGYAGRNEHGDFDVVVSKKVASQEGSKPAVQQVMHVRVLWKPMRGTKLDNPTATNAAIDWYVFDLSEKPGAQGLVAYTGAGFVTIKKENGVATLLIRNATLRPTTREGELADPIGPARVEGTIVARLGTGEKVRELLNEARQASARATDYRNGVAREASSRAPVEP